MAVEQRANIKFYLKLGKTAGEAYEMIKSVYGSDCLSHSNIFRWYAVFRDGREGTEDAPRAFYVAYVITHFQCNYLMSVFKAKWVMKDFCKSDVHR
jgi:hypothetical protein